MSKREDQKMAKLLKKTAGKIGQGPRQDRSAQYDSTLAQKPPEQDDASKRFFKDMKRREF
ncbi:MAG: hypothetical protein U0133_22375 [Gemmatimonadales bacterium]